MITSGHTERVAAVVVTYQGEDWVRPCLNSLKNSSYPVDIIVVDNHSQDQTVSILRKEFPDITLLVQDYNAGFGQANNIGIAHAIRSNADLIFLMNQDATVELKAIGKLVEGFHRFPRYNLLSPLHLDGTGKEMDAGFERYISMQYNFDLQQDDDGVFPIDFINAAAWLVRVKALKKVGGFAPLFFHYGEDRDWMNRFRYFGLLAGIIPSARIFHFREARNTDVRGWSESRKVRYYFVGWLARMANIRHSGVYGFLDGLAWSAKESTMLVVKGIWSTPVIFLKAFFKIVRTMPAVVKHRRIVKSPAPYQFLPCE